MTHYQYVKKHTTLTPVFFFAVLFLLLGLGDEIGKLRQLADGLLRDPSETFSSVTFFMGTLCLALILDHKLFWIQEQDRYVPLIRKYDFVPLTRGEFYGARLRLGIQFLLGYFLLYIVLFYTACWRNGLPISMWLAPLNVIVKSLLACAIPPAVMLLRSYMRDLFSRP